MNKTIEETSNLNYDERKKILFQKKTNITENRTEEKAEEKEGMLVSTVKSSMEVEYTEKGIKLAYSGLVKEKEYHDKHLIDLKNGLEDIEMTPELEKLREDLKKIAKIDQIEKSKKEIEATEERLKIVNKEIKEISETIGGRLKL